MLRIVLPCRENHERDAQVFRSFAAKKRVSGRSRSEFLLTSPMTGHFFSGPPPLMASGLLPDDGGESFTADGDDEISTMLSGRKVLIVEDEALLALELQLTVTDFGAEVVGPAHSLRQAEQLVATTEKIDGAILDVDIAGRDVIPVAHQLNERGVPFIFHTSYGSRADLADLFPKAPVCQKPSSSRQLFAALAFVMRGTDRNS